MPRVFALIVTYKPCERLLLQLLEAVRLQVAGGVIINNSVDLPFSDDHALQFGFGVLHLQSNLGVATALNAGFHWIEAQDADFVLTFDQDSEPGPNMVSHLLSAYAKLVASGVKVGAVGPVQVDRRTARHAPFLAPVAWQRHQVMPAVGEAVEVDHLITSGCLVPLQVWRDDGAFLDSLFIDYVDIEWCLRLRYRGWHFFGVRDASMGHSLGDEIKSLGPWHIPWHSELRHYCIFRNGAYLQRLPYVPPAWKFADGVYLLKKFVFVTLMARPRIRHVIAMLRGARDGWLARLGPPW